MSARDIFLVQSPLGEKTDRSALQLWAPDKLSPKPLATMLGLNEQRKNLGKATHHA